MQINKINKHTKFRILMRAARAGVTESDSGKLSQSRWPGKPQLSRNLQNKKAPAVQAFQVGGGCAKALPTGFVNSRCRKKLVWLEVVRLGGRGEAEVEGWAGPDHKGPCRPLKDFGFLFFKMPRKY